MTNSGKRFQEFSVFRIVIIALLTTIAVLQLLTLQRISSPYVTLNDLRAAKDPKVRRLLQSSVPLVEVYGAVEVEGSVDVQNTVAVEGSVDANVTNEPLAVESW